jgi:hypothetical protein
MTFFYLTVSFTVNYEWAKAWVDKSILEISDLKIDIKKQIKEKSLTLILLPKNELITTAKGNTYLKGFLVNNTDTTSVISRLDAVLKGCSTEILKDGIWQTFQNLSLPGCGNSNWKQNLIPQGVLSIRYDHSESGPLKVLFRIKFNHDKKVIYSNEIMIDLDQENYDRVGRSKYQ